MKLSNIEKQEIKDFTTTIEFIKELDMDIQYHKQALNDGWFKSQIGKNKLGGRLEYLESMAKKIKESITF